MHVSTYDPMDLRGQERAQDETESRERLAQEVEDQDLRWLMSSKRGRRIVWRLLAEAKPHADPFNTNAIIMSRNVGTQIYGRWLFARVQSLCIELYVVMVKENDGRRDDGAKSNER